MTDFCRIPIVDIAGWRNSSSAKARNCVIDEVREACTQVGFLYVCNHGVPQALIDSAFAEAERFFTMPEAQKMSVHYSRANRQRGYIPIKGEATDPGAGLDLKEAFDFGLVVPTNAGGPSPGDAAYDRMTSPNLWPDDLPSFRSVLDAYFNAMIALGRDMFGLFAAAAGASPDYFAPFINQPIAQMRLLHYPPQPVDPARIALGIGAHFDYECFTILAQDATGGLQVKNQAGAWIAAPPIPGCYVINIGEMLSLWTGGRFLSTCHRVINETGRERYSIPFFMATNHDTPIKPIGTPANVPSRLVTAGDYLAERLKEVYDQ